MSNIYDNLNIVETAVTYDGRTIAGSFAIAQNDFNLGTLNFLPDVPLEDQIEVERIFDTGIDSKFDDIVFTIADRRNMFVLPKGWYTINPQTKRMTINIPADTVDTNGLYYPLSRTYMTEGVAGVEGPQRVDIPNTLQFEVTQFNYTPPGGGGGSTLVTREQDIVLIRRKTLSKDSIVTFAPGTRLTTTQLNLQFNQLKFILQELISKVRNEIILKFDENAIDGPFLGNTDLKMSNRYIKNMNSPSILDINTDTGYPFVVGNTVTTGSSFAVNINSLHEAIYFGTLHREGVTEGDAAFTGHFSAAAQDLNDVTPTNRKIINLADGTNNTDAATFGQVKNASNISTGTLTNTVLSNIPLSKLSGVAGQGYTLPVDALANSGVTAGSTVSAGSTSAANANNMVSMTVDNKGRVTTIASRNMAVEDLPTVSTITPATYGQSSATNSNNMLQIGVDLKGRITGISHRTFGNSDLPTSGVTAATYGAETGTGTNTLTRFTVDNKGIITLAAHRSIEVNDLPTTSVTGAGTYGQATAGNSNNMLQVTYDARGRVTSISHRSMGTNDLPSGIPLSKLSGTNDNYTLPPSAIADTSITLAKINFGAGGTIPSGNLPSIDLGNINAANRGSFVLPEAAVPLVPSTNTAASTWNTLAIKDFKVDAKGRIFDVSHRAFTDGDIGTISANKITGVLDDGRIPAPSPAPTAGSYGSASNIPVITVDAKGRITTISTVTHAVANITDYTTATDGRIDTRALSRGTGSTYDAGSRRIIALAEPTTSTDAVTKNYVDTTFQTISGLAAAVTPTIQSNAIYWDSGNSVFTATRSAQNQKISGVADPTASNQVATKNYVDTQLSSYQTTAGLAAAVTPTIQSNAIYWDSTNSVFTATRSSNPQKIRGVATPSDNSDAVPLGYFNTNALVKVGSEITAGNAYISNLTMRSGAALADNDAVNYGYVRGLTLYGQAVTDPQTFTNTWPTAGTTVNGNKPYVFSLSTLAATTGEMLVVTDSQNRTYVPTTTVPAAAGQFFRLDTTVSPKTVTIYLDSTITPTGSATVRNFGTSRSVSAATAGAAVLGLVQVPTNGGLVVDGSGNITLNAGTTSQRGGYKAGNTLAITSTDLLNINITDTTNTTSSTTAASATAVNTLRQASMLLDGTQQMTGRLRTATATASLSSFNIPSTVTGPNSPVAGDIWNLNHVLQVRTDSATKQLAYRDAATTSSTGLVSIVSGNDGGISVTGAGAISLAQATSTQIGGIKQGTGLTITSGVASVNLSNAVDSTSTSTAASSQAVKTTYDYAANVQSNLNTTNSNLSTTNNNVTTVQTTANAALPKAGGTMTGLVTLATSSSTVTPLRFIGGSAPTSPADGAVWYEGNTLKMQNSSGTKTVAFTDSTLTGSAAAANKWTTGMTLTLSGDLGGNVTFDGSAGVTLNATIASNSVALGTDTTGNYAAAVTAGAGITVTGTAGEGTTFDIINNDRGSSQLIYGTVALAGTTSGDTSIAAASHTQTLTLNAGTGVSLAGNNATKTITITNTATQPNNFGTVIVGTTPTATNLVADSSNASFTVNAGTGISLSANATTDTLTINNAGVTSVAGTTNQVSVTNAGVGAVTLSLPQAINDAATVTFGSVTANNLRLGSSNNTIISTNTNGNINLAPDGTGYVNITKALDVDGTLNVDGATTLAATTINGAVTASNNISMTAADPQLQIGATGSNPIVIDRRTTAEAGVAIAGDLEFRMQTGTKAFLIPGLSTTTIANHEIITKGALNDTLDNYVTSANALTLAGGLNANAAQALGTSTAHNTTIATNNVVRVTVGSAGGVTINSGGLAVTDGNITISGSTGKVTAAASTVSGDGGKVLTTRDYVDAKKWNIVQFTSGTGTWTSPVNVTEIEVFMISGGNGGVLGSTTALGIVQPSGTAVYFKATIPSNTGFTYTVGAPGTASTVAGTRLGTNSTFLGVTAPAGGPAYFEGATITNNAVTSVTKIVIPFYMSRNTTLGDATSRNVDQIISKAMDFNIPPGQVVRTTAGTDPALNTGINWTFGSGFLPGTGGVNKISAGATNGSGGVGGIIAIRYWG